MQRVVCFSLLLLASCSGDGDRAYVNSGSLCLRATDEGPQAEVQVLECLSSTCTEIRAGACAVSLRDGLLSVTSRIVVDRVGGDASQCSQRCGAYAVQCELPPVLPDGPYTVAFGRSRVDVTLPLAADTPIVPGDTQPCSP